MQAKHDQSSISCQFLKRKFCRGGVAVLADIRAAGGNKYKVKVIDISQTGFRIECLTHIPGSQVIFLTLPSFQQLESRVIWQTEWLYGCQFVQPLHAAVYDHIIKTYPVLEEVRKIQSDGLVFGSAAGIH